MTQEVPKLPSVQLRGCTCGNGKKSADFTACKNSEKRKSKCVPVYELKYFAQVHVNACVMVTVMEANQTRLQIQIKI